MPFKLGVHGSDSPTHLNTKTVVESDFYASLHI